MRLYDRLLRTAMGIYKFLFRPRYKRVRCLVFRGDELLLVQHVGAKSVWTLPGGGKKGDEGATETARRELEEEFGLEVHGLWFAGKTTVKERFSVLEAELVVARTEDRELHPSAIEIRSAGFFTFTELPERLSPLVNEALETTEKSIAKTGSPL